MKLKVIKKKQFTVGAEQAPHTHYTVAYKGRVFGVSTLRFEGIELKEEGNTLVVPSEVEVLKNTSTDPLTGEVSSYLDIVPKLDIVLAGI